MSAAGRQIDLLDGGLYAGDPYPTYAWMRENAPVYYDKANDIYGVTRYADIVEIEKHPDLWCSSQGFRPKTGADSSMIAADDPLHHQRRSLVNRRFTPRAVREMEEMIRGHVRGLVDTVVAKGSAEVIADLAAPLPAMMIGHLLGFPHDAWPDLKHWSETVIELGGGPRYMEEWRMLAALDFHGRAREEIAQRRECPADDVLGALVAGEIDGCPLDDDVIASEALLLLVGGAETTRTCIAGAINALAEHPDQRQKLVDDPSLIPNAVDEFIRWVTPILNMTRHATRDTELHGVPIAANAEVVLMYSAANRDPAIFENPETFDVTRQHNHHIAFGFGTHFCLGAALARLEIRCMFEELLSRIPEWEVIDGPVRVPGAFVAGIERLDISFPSPAAGTN